MKRNYTKSYKSHVYPCVSSLLAPSGFYFSLILILKAKYGRNEKLSIANHLRTWPLSNDARRCPAVGSVLRSPCGAQNPQHGETTLGRAPRAPLISWPLRRLCTSVYHPSFQTSSRMSIFSKGTCPRRTCDAVAVPPVRDDLTIIESSIIKYGAGTTASCEYCRRILSKSGKTTLESKRNSPNLITHLRLVAASILERYWTTVSHSLLCVSEVETTGLVFTSWDPPFTHPDYSAWWHLP